MQRILTQKVLPHATHTDKRLQESHAASIIIMTVSVIRTLPQEASIPLKEHGEARESRLGGRGTARA